MKHRTISLAAFLLAVLPTCMPPAAAQSAPEKAGAILQAFNKRKHAVKEKLGVRMEKFKEIRSEPAVKRDIREYAGVYVVPELHFMLDLRVNAAGQIGGTGMDRAPADSTVVRRFTLQDARIEGALLTATRMDEGGETEPFAGLFIYRTEFDSPADAGKTRFGLGVLQHVQVGNQRLDRLFYERSR